MSAICPYCNAAFQELEKMVEHAQELHGEEIKVPVAKDLFFEDYVKEERVYLTLKKRFLGSQEPAPPRRTLEEYVMEIEPSLPVGSRRNLLCVLRILVSVWPCKHESDGGSEEDLDNCCENKKNIGEFMNLICDLYGDSDESDSE